MIAGVLWGRSRTLFGLLFTRRIINAADWRFRLMFDVGFSSFRFPHRGAGAVRSSLGIEVAREFDNFSTLASLGLGLFHGVGRKSLRSR